ncbi:hypothetical protein ES703_27204 [subsurface metagenome]
MCGDFYEPVCLWYIIVIEVNQLDPVDFKALHHREHCLAMIHPTCPIDPSYGISPVSLDIIDRVLNAVCIH